MTSRVSWTDYFLGIADSVAVRADCTRRRVGAVVVDPSTKHIIAAGYNGSPPGEPGCLSDGACPRGRHYDTGRIYNAALPSLQPMTAHSTCGCGQKWPCPEAVAPGSSYDTGKGACIALHAEQNATIRAGERARGAWLFLTEEPCDACWRLVKGAGYAHVSWYGGEWASGVPESSLKLWTLMHTLDRSVRRWFSRSGRQTRS